MKKIFCLLLTLSVFSCAFPSTKEGMTVKNYKSPKPIGEKIYVKKSTGGSTTLPFWTSEISDEDFTAAVKDSLLNSKTFTSLANDWNEDWGLEIEILDVNQPIIGADFDVQTNIKYSLYLKNNKIYETVINKDGFATMQDTFFAVKRLRLANEKSAQANIESFIKEISNKKLK